MKNKTDIEENIKILNNLKNKMDFNNQNDLVLLLNFQEQQALENILADRERLEKENRKLTYARDWYFEHTVNKIVTPEMLHKILRTKYISRDEIEDKINKEELPLTIIGGRRNSKTLNYGIKLGRRQVLQELLDTEKEKIK